MTMIGTHTEIMLNKLTKPDTKLTKLTTTTSED